MTDTAPVLLSVANGVAHVEFNRPQAFNAADQALAEGLEQALLRVSADDSARVVVLSGRGRAFCAGGDVKAMAAGGRMQGASHETKVQDLRARMRVSEMLHDMPKPTIAMVNGVAAGAGLSLALACDMRFVGKSARMTTAFAKVGFSGDFGSHFFLHKLVGTAKARELYFTAEILNSEKIEKLGLANWVVDDDKLHAEAMGFAKKLASCIFVTTSERSRPAGTIASTSLRHFANTSASCSAFSRPCLLRRCTLNSSAIVLS